MKGSKGVVSVVSGNRVFKAVLSLAFSVSAWFQASAISAVPVKFGWNSSSDATVAGYAVYYGIVNSGTTNRLDVGADLTATIKDLQADANYFFYVVAYNATGVESDPSPLIQYAPPAMTSLKLTSLEDGTMRVQFKCATGALCQVEYSESLDAPQWQVLSSATANENGDVTFDDPATDRPAIRFYRGVLP